MRYIMVAIWAILISSVVSYVLTSMANEPFNLTHSMILAAIFAIIIFILGDGVLRNKQEQ